MSVRRQNVSNLQSDGLQCKTDGYNRGWLDDCAVLVGKVDKHHGSSRFVGLLFSCMKLDWTRLVGRADRLVYPRPCQIPDYIRNLSLKNMNLLSISQCARLFLSLII